MRRRQYLSEHHFNITHTSQNGQKESLLAIAARQGNQQAFQWLLEHGADVNCMDSENNSLLHIAGVCGNQCIAMVLLSILWRKTVLFSGYPDFMHVNKKGEDAVDVTTDESLKGLIRACIDRYSVVSVKNLNPADSIEGGGGLRGSFVDIRNRIMASCTLKESIRQAKFIVNDCVIMPEQEHDIPARLCASNQNSFIIYVPPTLHILEQVGVEIKNPAGMMEKEALNMLIYSFSHLTLDPSSSNGFRSSYSMKKIDVEKENAVSNSSRMMSVAGESNNRIYKPVSAGGNSDEKRKMIENNMKECCIFCPVCSQ